MNGCDKLILFRLCEIETKSQRIELKSDDMMSGEQDICGQPFPLMSLANTPTANPPWLSITPQQSASAQPMCKIFKIFLQGKVTHAVYSELSTENVDKAITIQKPLHREGEKPPTDIAYFPTHKKIPE
ncbi:hypothetical protein XV92_11865 [Vibrio metoecus]|uniref:Uncharacterized protein n=3 Tax=Vibrio metoecus TaxID=1481663 RepID=A0A0Q0TGE3_VIBMT|nr:hypothetical protein XV92_11865 [Vibrio metoecus]